MEIWKNIEGYKGLYQISNLGRVRSLDRYIKYGFGMRKIKGKIKKNQILKNKGYNIIVLSKDNKKKTFLVHRLVALHFISNPDNKPQVNHIDGDKENNSVENLEFVTNQENRDHAIENGLVLTEEHRKSISKAHRGVKNNKAKLNDEKIIIIKKLLNYKYSQRFIAKIFNVHQSIICDIKNNKTWKHVKFEEL